MGDKPHWEGIYRDKAPDSVSWYQEHPGYSLELIQAAGIGKGQPIIDIGGGASRLADLLLDADYKDLTVLDIASTALAHAQRRLGERAQRITWLEADATDFSSGRRYALWHDRAVFHFLTDSADRWRYLDNLRQSLLPKAQVIIATFAPDGPEQCSGLPVVRYDAAKITRLFGEYLVLQETRNEAHRTPSGKVQHFSYFRCSLSAIPLSRDVRNGYSHRAIFRE